MTFWVSGSQPSWGAVPIGRPIANTQVYILDEHMQPLHLGVPGELYIGGVGVSRGYLGQPELTAERFVPDPFGAAAGARLFKTGDRARHLPDGNLEFLGRLDYQVKLRGLRIELGEIEATLREHPEVRDAVVVLREDRPEAKRLVAYLMPRGDAALTGEALRRFLAGKFPDFMMPTAVVLLSALPLTASGKVDRNSLPPPDPAQPGGDPVAPRNALERQLAQIWNETLGVHPAGVTDDFFELGGHSLLAGRLLARVRDQFRVDVDLRPFFAAPTIAGLATIIVQKLAARGSAGGSGHGTEPLPSGHG